ncbi:MAG: rhomboid family intramembrane serine protease [Candidatus Omnitrophica bacterium]|nr:rhomboid family intramembrane serine protease [Candidatus Omnitrophota bacterium]
MFFFFPLRDEYRVKRFPVIAASLIIINVALFLLHASGGRYEEIIMKYGFIPSRFSLLTLITSMFLHGGILHVGFNMWYLWLLGNNIEDRWGRMPFLLFYVSAGIFSMLLYSALVPETIKNIPTIGASGAIAAILGAYAVLFPRSRITFKYFLWLFIFIIRFGEFKLYAAVWLAFWFFQQAFSTMLTAKGITAGSVAFGAHFAGFVYGAVIGLGTKLYREAKFRENVQLGENVLFNLLGGRHFIPRSMEESGEIERGREKITNFFSSDKNLAAKYYSELAGKYPEAVMDEKIQYGIAVVLDERGEKDAAFAAFKNFVLNYPLSKLADKALLAIGKFFMEKGEYRKAGSAFMQIAVFYPYSEVYEEAKYYLDKKLPELKIN